MPKAELERTGMLCKTFEGQEIAIFKFGQDYFAIDNICSHAGGRLCEGMLDGKIIECPLHSSQFDIATGAVLGPPASRSQKTYPVRIHGEFIEIEITSR